VQDDQRYTICLQEYHFRSAERIFSLPAGALDELRRNSIVATSGRDVLEEYLSSSQNLTAQVEGRLEYR